VLGTAKRITVRAVHFDSVFLIVFFGLVSGTLGAETDRTTLGLTSRVGSFTLPFVIVISQTEQDFWKRRPLISMRTWERLT